MGSPIGIHKDRIQNGSVISGSRFTHWFKDTFLAYSPATAPVIPVASTVNISVNGVAATVPAKLINDSWWIMLSGGSTYIKIRDVLIALGFGNLEWSAVTNTILASKG